VPTPTATDQLGTTPAGRALRWLLECMADPAAVTPAAVAARLSPAAAAAVPPEQYAPALAAELPGRGGVTVDRVETSSPNEAAARLVASDGGGWVLRCVVDAEPPHLVALTQLAPARLPTDAGCGAPVPWPDLADPTSVGGGDARDDRLDDAVRAARAELRAPCVLAGVVAGGRLTGWTDVGYAEVATRRRPTRRTALRLASVSTVLTALAVHRLVDAGRIGIDDPIGAHVPSPTVVTPDGRPVRVRHLLEHTSGVPTDPRLALGVQVGTDVPPLDELVGGELRALVPAGERFGHSPVGYALLGALVERVTGRDFADEVAGAVLDPLGMRRTSYRLDDRIARQPLCGYDVDFDEVLVAGATDPVLRPAAGAVSTLEDLGVLAGALLAPERRALVAPAAPTGVAGVATTRVGLLWADDGGRPVAWHCGGWPGALAGVFLAPEDGVGVVVAANAFSPSRLARLDELGLELLATVVDREPS